MIRTSARPLSRGLVAALLILGQAPSEAAAQDGAGAISAACSVTGTAGAGPCAVAAVAGQALVGHAGLLSSLGSDVPGSASTIGRGILGAPRLSLSLRTGLAGISLPDPGSTGSEVHSIGTSIQAGAAIGLFDGFRPHPLVGGFLSTDVFLSGTMVVLPGEAGFAGSVGSLGYGVRWGILRESFTLPGVTVSASRRHIRRISFGSVADGDRFEARVVPTVFSLRGTVGKDVRAVGLLAGIGWERYGGALTVQAGDAVATTEGFRADRLLGFGGATWTHLIVQVSLEGGWAQGFNAPPEYGGEPFDPSTATHFGAVAVRITP